MMFLDGIYSDAILRSGIVIVHNTNAGAWRLYLKADRATINIGLTKGPLTVDLEVPLVI